MTQTGPQLDTPAPKSAALSPTDLAELMTAFTEVTAKLEQTHAQLRGEVSRLNAELRDANDALQRSRRLAALGEMAAGISHEIRNPLGSIRLYANMLGEDLASMPEQRRIVEKIGRAVRGLDEIVGDVLTFAREMKVQWVPSDAGAMIDAALEMCCAEIRSEVIREDVAHDAVELVCDAHLIQQALINILRNAGEANRVSGGERITISVAPRTIEDDDRRVDGVAIGVRDQGAGIPDEVLGRMFNPFFTTRASGTGLGLAIVHRIVDAHRGTIEVKNHTDPRGASVELVLPLRQAVIVSRGTPGAVPAGKQVQPQPMRLQSAMG